MVASGKFLLDTNIAIALLEGDEAVLSNLDQAREVFVPAIVFGELFFGAAKSSRPQENSAKLEQFAVGRIILPCDLRVAREYGRLKQDLRSKGKPIPENDIWIAAIATSHELVLATRDRHFRDVDGLVIAAW
ncbi:MAG TPA: type II toxin-antitoxin system VapC family toxin [Verrucomicrobiae bacterium]|nr:type II toxin-antitoxin system VapC family toxin [Verrucomicrobiae bacterium]